ncbi:uncharacterized protein [Diadema setosum]|uniref:uncharacterized protein n=1 Tax=Diadema setosum TaxID=31175 RepID=UPI003B3ABA0F
MYKNISKELRLQVEKVVLFTDSMITLQWIKSPARTFKSFVSSRVGEIQTLTYPSQWKHIPGEVNVADKVSRGIPVDELENEWKQGPDFLRHHEAEWPVDKVVTDQRATNEEKRKTQSILTVTKENGPIDCKRFSSWRRLVRVTAYVFKFIQLLKARTQKGQPN